jgi:ubiquinone/menaquinone biosynthesis C-methylase UbiE
MLTDTDEMVQAHYQSVAEKYGDSPQSTMEDEVVREKEIHQILNFISGLEHLADNQPLRVLDLGCGNGYALTALSKAHPANHYYGTDFSEALLAIARTRESADCEFRHADARDLPFEDGFFDAVYTERCLINILDWEQQRRALQEIARVLKPGGSYLMIECFTDGLDNNNRARQECGLGEIKAAYHNKYFEKDVCFKEITDWFTVVSPDESNGQKSFEIPESNFLSSHYFIARVLHPLVTRGTAVKNTEFVKFFSFLPPTGNYSPIQAYVLRKKTSED